MTTTEQRSTTNVVVNNTTMATWAGAISRALLACGVDAKALFNKVGVDYALVNRPDKRIPVEDMTRLWTLAVEATDDSCFGLIVARHVNLTTFHALGVAAIASETVSDAANMITRFASMISDGIDMQVHMSDEEVGLFMNMRPHYPRFADACVEAIFASIVLTARQITPTLQLSQVKLQHRCADDPLRYQQLFDCPVEFGAKEDGLLVSRDIFSSASLPASSPGIAQANAALCEEYLTTQQHGNVSTQVRKLISRKLHEGELLSLPDVASTMAMSERKLQRLLREEGVRYKDLLDDVRGRIARHLLANDNLPVGRVAEQLGFESLSAFSRAVRRWSGMTPRALRQSTRDDALQ